MTRLAFALALLLGGLALSQPNTYFAPIVARTPGSSPVGATAMGAAIWLPDSSAWTRISHCSSGTGGGTSVPFVLNTQAPANLTGLPAQVDAVAAAPGVLVEGISKTLLAVLSNGGVNSRRWRPMAPATPTEARSPPSTRARRFALSAVPGGGAALLVSDGFQITRFEIDPSINPVGVSQGGTISAGATDQGNALVFDGFTNQGFVGGRVLGDLYQFDARLDAGPPSAFDIAMVSQGRLAGPVTGLALYSGTSASYLLAANGQGLTVYDLNAAVPRSSGFRVIPVDAVGPITAPAGVAVTNLAVDAGFPGGVIAVGDRTQTDLALLRWDLLASQVDGGLVIDTGFDPRGSSDGGLPDGGVPDSGTPDSGTGGGSPSNGGGPLGPGIPVDHGSSCTTAAGAPFLALLLAGLGLLPRRRQRR